MDAFAIRMPPRVQSIQVGAHQIVFIDDFIEDPQALVEVACRSEFKPEPGVDAKKGYPGIRAQAPSEYSAHLVDLVEPLVKLNFGVPEALNIRKSPCSFSLTTTAPQDLGPLQRTPHFDASTPYHMAVLLYLCGDEHGGTGFYRHNATGLQRITAESRERYLDIYYEEINARSPPHRYFSTSDEQFTCLGIMPARFNRLVVYPGSLLHSACVNPARSICSDPRQGRLTISTFFDFA